MVIWINHELEEYLKIAKQAAREAGEMLKVNIYSHCEIAFKAAVDVLKNDE